MHNDDTSMRILRLAREPADARTGIFTSGIVSLGPGWKIALYFSGVKHAGENLAELLKRRPPGLAPLIQMCDALSWNTSHLPEGVQRLLAHCMSHGRRQFVEVAENFPEECRYVLETLGGIWHHDALARLSPAKSAVMLPFHWMRILPRGPSNSMTHSAPLPVPGVSNSTNAAGGALSLTVLRPAGCDSVASRLSLPYSRLRTLAVRNTPCSLAASAAALHRHSGIGNRPVCDFRHRAKRP
jgi:hypothetical protein